MKRDRSARLFLLCRISEFICNLFELNYLKYKGLCEGLLNRHKYNILGNSDINSNIYSSSEH